MNPTLLNGEIIIYKPINNINGKLSIKEGSIVVAKNPLIKKGLIVKRVYKNTTLGLILRGDNLFFSIDSRDYGLINKKDVYGIVDNLIPNPFSSKGVN